MADCGFEAQDIRTMVMFGQGEDATPWVKVNSRADVTRFVLFTAAQFGQVKTLQMFIANGDPYWLDTYDHDHIGWNLYHYAVQGYKMNCNYLVSSTESNSNLPTTFEDARETQLDIIHALAEGGVMPFDPRNPELGCHSDQPPHPSQLALDVEYNFLEAAYLIDILVILHSDPNSTVSTPGLEMIQVSNNKEYKVALHHLMKWSYDKNYLDILGYCHDRYHSVCGDVLRLQPGNLPMFLDAITTSKLDVVQLVFEHEEKKPLPDRLMSKVYEVGPKEARTKASAVSIACNMVLDGGEPYALHNLICHRVIGDNLLNIALSELQLENVPVDLFHERLNSLSLSSNNLANLPPVSQWKCKNLMFFSIEYNRFENLPDGLFNLPKLLTFNAGNNRISQLDMSMWRSPSLKNLYLSKNQLKTLPSPILRKMSIEEQDGDGNNQEESLNTVYQIFGISHGFVNQGVQRSDDIYKSGKGYNLQVLDLSDNNLEAIPNCLPCLAPQLRTLKLSRNMIKDFKSVSEYPSGIKSLELINNNATECIRGGSRVSVSHCQQSSPGNVINCLHREHTSLVELHHLNLNKNMLTEIILEEMGPLKSLLFSGPSQPSSRLLFPNLKSLSFAHNELRSVPESIYKQTSLFNLDISQNQRITKLPLKIHLLHELAGFQYKGITDPIIKQLDNCKDLGHIRHYLRAKQTQTIPNSMMRVNIIGHYKKGKTTVLRNICKHASNQKKEFSMFTSSTDQSWEPPSQSMLSKTWTYLKKRLPSGQALSFCTWVLGGQDEYYPVHNCFLTNRALYILVWKVTDRDSGINGLGIWLRNLQAKAPGSQVIIVGTHIDVIPSAERATFMRNTSRMISEMYNKPSDHGYPKIRRVEFVGNNEDAKLSLNLFTNFIANKYDELLDVIFEEAMKMEIPKTRDMKLNFHMKILEEQLPKTYLDLEEVVIRLRDRREVNIMHRSEFCQLPMVKDIINECSEVDTAMDSLQNRGTVFHFNMNDLEDYYILNTQWWFEVCGLVVSSENVDSLIATGDRYSGIIGYENIECLFKTRGIEEYTSLVLQFLHQHEVILPIDSGSALVPSLLTHTPTLERIASRIACRDSSREHSHFSVDIHIRPYTNNTCLKKWLNSTVQKCFHEHFFSSRTFHDNPHILLQDAQFKLSTEPGMFPCGTNTGANPASKPQPKRHNFHKFVPAAANKSLQADVSIKRTGLVLRRMFLLPPIGPDFWNRVINLCLQKGDFPEIVREIFDDNVQMKSFYHGQFHQIGMNCHMRWKYWRSGITLELNTQVILSINSLKSDEFTDPTQQSVISETNQKVNRFKFFDEKDGYFPLNGYFSEVFEVIVPEICIVSNDGNYKNISSKLLTKSLEIIDEVLRGYSTDLGEDGIFTLSRMFHVIPCPLCFGDSDRRPREPSLLERSISVTKTRPRLGSVARNAFQSLKLNRLSLVDSIDGSVCGPGIVVFSIDQCIEVAVSGAKYIECPNHGNIELDHIAPDLCFNDLSNLKLDMKCLTNPPGNDGTPVGQGCFGIVYHKLLNYDTGDDVHVAIKEFVVDDMFGQNEQTDEVKKYSDMRYEINKLSVLNHDYIVKFVGVVARPPSFVLEWAPLMSLEKIRVRHERQRVPMCPVSLYITLLQVLDGLHYLHAPPIGIIHSDLKLSNILAFEFPMVGHTCCNSIEDRGRCAKAMPELSQCGITVKLGDMGVCVNPTGHDAGDNLGVKRFAPECNTLSEKKLTEKVDIFCLGICLYELLSLTGLPPMDYSELEYRKMLSRGWRPSFHTKNTNFPLPLKLLLEQCWEQDYTKRPSALILKNFIEGVTGISVERKFEVQEGEEAMNHCLDGYMLVSDNQEVTAFHMVAGHKPLLIYLAICEDRENKVIALEAMDDDETKEQFFKATVIDQCGEEKVTAIHVTSKLDAVLGYQGGRVVYIKAKGGYPQAISNNLCNEDFNHGELNFIQYIEKEELIVTGFENGAAHVMKVQARYFSEMFLRGFYCCKKETFDLTATGSYAVLYKPMDNQLEVWCGCNKNQIEVWNFPLYENLKWRQSLVNKTNERICLSNSQFTPHSSIVCSLSVTPDRSTVFALIGDATKKSVLAICQIDAATGKPLRFWRCDMERVSYFSATATDLIVGTTEGHSLVYCRQSLEPEDVYEAKCDVDVLSHANQVSQVILFDGSISPDGYTSMFHSYLGIQRQDTPCRYIVSIGNGFINPLQFNSKAPTNSANDRDGYCINVWAV